MITILQLQKQFDSVLKDQKIPTVKSYNGGYADEKAQSLWIEYYKQAAKNGEVS